jgi:hypothetical protein
VFGSLSASSTNIISSTTFKFYGLQRNAAAPVSEPFTVMTITIDCRDTMVIALNPAELSQICSTCQLGLHGLSIAALNVSLQFFPYPSYFTGNSLCRTRRCDSGDRFIWLLKVQQLEGSFSLHADIMSRRLQSPSDCEIKQREQVPKLGR